MIIISIGRNPNNRIVIHDISNSVSGNHGEIKIADSGSITYRDMSKNGTKVNGKIINNQECQVQRGAAIIFPNNTSLDWNQVPFPSQLKNVKKEISIGKSQDNQIRLNDDKASRYHAILKVTADGKYYLYDQSMNGTLVNGNKIPKYQDCEVRRKDKIFFANADRLDWKDIPGGGVRPLHYLLPLLLLVMIGLGAYWWKHRAVNSQERYGNALCLVYNSHYLAYLNGNDTLYYIGAGKGEGYTIFDVERRAFFYITSEGMSAAEGKTFSELQPIEITGSGFFVSETGKIITNKHVAAPWESDLAVDKEKFQTIIGYINSILGGAPNYNPRIVGIHNKIGVFLNNSEWDKSMPFKNLIECKYIRSAAEKEIDLALVQTSNKALPSKAGYIQNSDVIADRSEINVGDDIVITGYPRGFTLATADDKINATYTYGHISQIRGKYEIQYDAPTFHGASGSPVFNKEGKLVAVNYAGMDKTQGFNFGIIATHIRPLLAE